MRLAENVVTLRTSQGLSTRVLATQCHLARRTVQDIEAGQSGSPSLTVLDEIAKVLGVSTASLLSTEPFPRSATYVDVHHALAVNVRLVRAWLAWSQEELSQHSGVSRSMISHIERGERNPLLDTLVRLAVAMNTSVERLLQP